MKGMGIGVGRLWLDFHQVPEHFAIEGWPLSILLPEYPFPCKSHTVYMNLGESSICLAFSPPLNRVSVTDPQSYTQGSVSGKMDKGRKVGRE